MAPDHSGAVYEDRIPNDLLVSCPYQVVHLVRFTCPQFRICGESLGAAGKRGWMDSLKRLANDVWLGEQALHSCALTDLGARLGPRLNAIHKAFAGTPVLKLYYIPRYTSFPKLVFLLLNF